MNSPLHVHFINKDILAFRSLLEFRRSHTTSAPSTPSSLGTSLSRSWKATLTLPKFHESQTPVDINRRDHLGRTVLHLAAASLHPSAIEFSRALLSQSSINVNLQDTESHWTALHRALWVGNLSLAILLLQRPDVDISLKDFDGYTAFDLYNSTVEHTSPPGEGNMDLFVWGNNRNAALGLGDAGDRSLPEQVDLSKDRKAVGPARFLPVYVNSVSMARLHTGIFIHFTHATLPYLPYPVVIINEPRFNVAACGFGNGGRLGPGHDTQYSLTRLEHLSQLSITQVALGQDHTLVLTSSGEVYSWGLNRFHQLGYAIEAKATKHGGQSFSHEEQIQFTARKVYGPLKREEVVGVAACKIASACWTARDVYTWGTNLGQLGSPDHCRV